MLKRLVWLTFFPLIAVVFLACGDDNSSTGPAVEPCPENAVCDTTYVDKEAYSFIYYSGKGRKDLDTVTAPKDEMECEIGDDDFKCVWTWVVQTCRVMYSYSGQEPLGEVETEVVESEDGEQYFIHHYHWTEVRLDTTYINYTKKRLIDYIPPYIETPKLDVDELRAEFDTLEIDLDTLYDDGTRYYGHVEYSTPYTFDDVYELPDGIGAYTSGFSTVVDSATGLMTLEMELISLSACYATYVTKYPLKQRNRDFVLYAFLDEPLERDTTITWMAHYSDIYGVEDSLEITTLFTMKEGL